MNVFAYYESICLHPEREKEQIRAWAQSWRNNGWNPVVIGRQNAELHPEFGEYYAAISNLPTVNYNRYEASCYLRHLAMEWIGGGLLTDYDVINIGFSPTDLPDEPGFIGHKGTVPCVVWSEDASFFRAIRMACQHANTANYITVNGRPHCSDMTVVHSDKFHTVGICCEYEHSPDYRLVHLSSTILNKDKDHKLLLSRKLAGL